MIPIAGFPASEHEKAQNELAKYLIFSFALFIGFLPRNPDFMSMQMELGLALAFIPFLLSFMALRSPLLEQDVTPVKTVMCCILPGIIAVYVMPYTWAITLAIASIVVCSPIYLIIGADEQAIQNMIEPLMHYWMIPFGDGLFILLNWGFALLGLRLAGLLPKAFGAGRWRSVFMIYGGGFVVAASLGFGRFLQPYIGYSAKTAGTISAVVACGATFLLMRKLSKPWFPEEVKQVAATE